MTGDCEHISASLLGNSAPYGSGEGSAPSSISWESSVPSILRVGEHFLQEGVLLDIFNVSITSASNLISFVMSVSEVTSLFGSKSSSSSSGQVSLIGLTTTAPRDLDGSVRLSPAVSTTSAARLPLSLTLSIASRPYSLPTQTFKIELSECTGGYVKLDLAGQQYCLKLLNASTWARAIAGALAGLGCLFILFLWALLAFKTKEMVHFGRTASPVCMHAVCFGSLLVLISVLTWMSDSDSNCTARPWLAVIGLAIMLSGMLVISSADVLRAHGYAPNDTVMLAVLVVVSLAANIAVLIVWTVSDPYHLARVTHQSANTLEEYCYSSQTVYIWILVGLFAGFGALFLLSLLLQSNYTFRYRQSKHFALYAVQAAVVSGALIPVAAVYFHNLDVFFLVVTLGLVGVAVLPVVPLLGLRAYRVFVPMTGKHLEEHVDWLRNDHRHRCQQVNQISSASNLGPSDSRFSLRANPSGSKLGSAHSSHSAHSVHSAHSAHSD